MTDAYSKEMINNMTRKLSSPDAKVVYVRHCNEKVPLDGRPGLCGSICHLIHPDVTLAEFFS